MAHTTSKAAHDYQFLVGANDAGSVQYALADFETMTFSSHNLSTTFLPLNAHAAIGKDASYVVATHSVPEANLNGVTTWINLATFSKGMWVVEEMPQRWTGLEAKGVAVVDGYVYLLAASLQQQVLWTHTGGSWSSEPLNMVRMNQRDSLSVNATHVSILGLNLQGNVAVFSRRHGESSFSETILQRPAPAAYSVSWFSYQAPETGSPVGAWSHEAVPASSGPVESFRLYAAVVGEPPKALGQERPDTIATDGAVSFVLSMDELWRRSSDWTKCSTGDLNQVPLMSLKQGPSGLEAVS